MRMLGSPGREQTVHDQMVVVGIDNPQLERY